ncbi:aminotransferase class I/II-fold pyridoxal phosphate-dependent enzyme [Leuconostoc miyukkimchii]|uniref:aminotransferase class I/II-fold pyridoxal phosphate-dependent enzyme n=1 Tax=Leuconostoc miyukkimchii TaxID=910540 RepID=UPI001C7D18CC|nr:aminotransferase class I/II-fold pyridoxal phosphate-dependent enzyme [Leuconostoc miyukkimchii]
MTEKQTDESELNAVAVKINSGIKHENPYVYDMLSTYGREVYFSKDGNVKQIADAKKYSEEFNATSGFATEHGQPMYLPLLAETLSTYDPADIFLYSSTLGTPELRDKWQEKMYIENPSLTGKKISKPIATIGLTHGLNLAANLFVDEGDTYILPDKQWENYKMIFSETKKAHMITYPMYDNDFKFNTSAFRETLLSQRDKKKIIIILNFPNNPTGYTPLAHEADELAAAIKEVADIGVNVVVISDDAYFGLFYKDSITESLFGRLANIHPRVLAIKVDGATKEEYTWGFRVGFLTFGINSDAMNTYLEEKVMGVIRTTISNGPTPSQTFILHALKSPELAKQKADKYEIMHQRANKIDTILSSGKYDDAWDLYPFNSGYFFAIKVKGVDADTARIHLLQKYHVGTIALGNTDLRVAFSRVDIEHLEELIKRLYEGIKDLQ